MDANSPSPADDNPDDASRAPLTRRERTVYDAIAERSPTHAAAYRRMIELTSTLDVEPTAVVLAGHLARELMNSLPRVLTEIPRPKHVDYLPPLNIIAEAWPRDAAGKRGPLPEEATRTLAILVGEHERSRSRRHEAAELVTAADPAGRSTVPAAGIGQWRRLLGRAISLAHALMRDQGQPMPDTSDARSVVDELTATLHAILAPFYESMATIDAVLAREKVTAADAAEAAVLLKTAAQFDHFFRVADIRWLEPLATAGFFREPPGLEDAGEGYVRTPSWPEGDYLLRMAETEPDRVAEIAEDGPIGDNPMVGRAIVQIAAAVPPAAATRLIPRIVAWLGVPLTAQFVAIDALHLAVRFADDGDPVNGLRVYEAALDASVGLVESGDEWHLEQALSEPLERLFRVDARRVAGLIQNRLERALVGLGGTSQYSRVWIPRVDRVPPYGRERPGRLANALYRVLLHVDRRGANGTATSFVRRRESVLVRIGMAVTADHPERVGPVDEILAEADRWDASDARYEFRRVVRTRLRDASEASRTAVLEYAARAIDAHDAMDRGDQTYTAEERDFHVRRWRTRFLGATWEAVPAPWQTRLGPLVEGEPFFEELCEVEARFVPDSAHTKEELVDLDPHQLLALVRDWSPTGDRPFETRSGLAGVAADVMVGDLERHLPILKDWASSEPGVVAEIARRLGAAVEGEQLLRLDALTPFMWRALESLPDAPERSNERADATRWLAWLVEHLARHDRLGGPSPTVERLIDELNVILGEERPVDEDETLRPGWGPLELALNSPHGAVISAAVRVAIRLHETLGCDAQAARLADHLRATQGRLTSIASKAAFGLALPLMLVADAEHADAWIERVAGDDVPDDAWRAAFHAYVVSWRYLSSTGHKLVAPYRRSLRELGSREAPGDGDDRWVEALGAHALLADLRGLEVARTEEWVRQWYVSADQSERSVLTRLMAEFAGEGSEPGSRARARTLLRWRIDALSTNAPARELRSVSWASSATDEPATVLAELVLPALAASGGGADDGPGVVRLIADQAAVIPEQSVTALRLAVDGDEYGVLPTLAGADLVRALRALLRDSTTSQRAERIINDLGARGFKQFHPLLDEDPRP